jgi:hypothetical protein
MIANDHELHVTLDRIAQFQAQVAHLRQVEAHQANYHAAASGFLAEIDRMQLEAVRKLSIAIEHLSSRLLAVMKHGVAPWSEPVQH